VQNQANVRDWMQDVQAGRLPVAKGVAVSVEDAMRAALIEQVMTYLSVDPEAVAACHGLPAPQADLEALTRSGVVTIESGRVIVNPAYRPLARLVAAAFDGYLASSAARHSVSV
jgi:oxygen-independent coproporphyrinogen-3 oxidase